jgi:hypothetical protein
MDTWNAKPIPCGSPAQQDEDSLMTATVDRGTVIFRRWNKQTGLDETEETFATLTTLFELCLQADDALLVDRVTIEGRDGEGSLRTVTLVFQSVTVAGRDGG